MVTSKQENDGFEQRGDNERWLWVLLVLLEFFIGWMGLAHLVYLESS